MENHIVEILVILLRKYPEGAINPDEFEPLTRDLMEQGYTQQEIETALFWYHSRQSRDAASRRQETLSPNSFRVLHEVERTIISPQAYGYLLQLHHLRLITLDEMDAIIERAVLSGARRVDVEDIKNLAALQIMEKEGAAGLPESNFYLRIPGERIQ